MPDGWEGGEKVGETVRPGVEEGDSLARLAGSTNGLEAGEGDLLCCPAPARRGAAAAMGTLAANSSDARVVLRAEIAFGCFSTAASDLRIER